MQVGQFVCSKGFQEPLCKIWETTAQDAKELENEVSYLGLLMIGGYFEGISSLVRRGLVRGNSALEAYALDVLWKEMSPWIIALRADNPGLYKGFEDLARRRALTLFPWIPSDLPKLSWQLFK